MTDRGGTPHLVEASVRKSVLFVICEHAVVIGSGFAISVILARGLSQQTYGTVKVFEYLALVATYLFSLGLERTLGRYIAEIRATVGSRQARRVFLSLVAIRLGFCLVLGVLVFAFADQLGELFAAPVLFIDYAALTAAFLVLTLLNNLTGRAWLTALSQRHLVSVGLIARRIVLMVAVTGLLFYGLELTSVLWAIFAALIVEFSILGFFGSRNLRHLGAEPGPRSPTPLPREIRQRIIRFISFNAPWQWMQVFREIAVDSLIIAAMLGPSAVAYYAIAAVIPQLLRSVSPTKRFIGILIPKIVRKATVSGDTESLKFAFDFLTKINLSIFAPLALLILLNLDWLIVLMYGEAYGASHIAAALLMCSLMITIAADPYYLVCDVLDLPDIMFRSGLLGTLNLALDIVLVKSIGIEGAAIATLIVSVALLVYFHIALARRYGNRFIIAPGLVSKTLAGLAVIGAADFLARLGGEAILVRLAGALLGAAAYAGLLWRFHSFTQREIARFNESFFAPIVRRIS